MHSRKLTKPIAIGAAAIALAIGGTAIVHSSSSSSASGTANAATATTNAPTGTATAPTGTANAPTATTNAPSAAQPGQHQPNQTVVGQVPQNWSSGSGTIITGAAADQAKAAALAKYPGGTVNRVLQLSDGSYAVHMIKISWPHHVFVSTTFAVTGAIG
jgi:hypothetical protein